MKKMTKMLSVILTVAMMAAMLVACGSSDSKKSDEKTESTDSKDTIKFGTNAEFPPFEYVTQEGVIGEFDGIDIAIAKDIAEENGMEPVCGSTHHPARALLPHTAPTQAQVEAARQAAEIGRAHV